MTTGRTKELTTIKDTSKIINGKKAMLKSSKETGQFDTIRKSKQRPEHNQSTHNSCIQPARHSRTSHQMTQCPAYGQICNNCSRDIHLNNVCRSTPQRGRPPEEKGRLIHKVQ